MKWKCPQCGQNLKAALYPLDGMYDLYCPPHSRIRFNKEHQVIEYILHTPTHSLSAYSKDFNNGVFSSMREETILYKRTAILKLPYFLSFTTQEELDNLIPRLLNLLAFS